MDASNESFGDPRRMDFSDHLFYLLDNLIGIIIIHDLHRNS